MDAISTLDRSEAAPEPGDPIVCIRCACVMTIDEDRRLTGFTQAQTDELVADAEWMDLVFKAVGKVHFLNHITN
jgi:hypothetical protein